MSARRLIAAPGLLDSRVDAPYYECPPRTQELQGMGYTIDIDTGGTFTDCFVHRDGEARTAKVPTTPHDLTVCFLDSIEAGARAFGLGISNLLDETDVIRFSSTIGTNTIINRDGTKVGLLVTSGAEFLAPTTDPTGRPPLLAADMVLGLDEAVDETGCAVAAPAHDAILHATQTLVDRGARCLVVALANAERNPAHERAVRDTIKAEYPRDYLGSVPVFLSADLAPRPGYAARIAAAVLNAYVHAKLARLLYKAGEDLRRLQYRGPLLIGHNTGTVARVAKTRALHTYNSGPAAGLLGAREIGRLYDADNLIATDMGGTSFDIGYVRQGQASYTLEPDVEGLRCNLPMLAIRALGAGGGSIARVIDGILHVGPESTGGVPGPACFDLGGTDATLTDANLVLGLLDPDYFLGGSMRLSREAATSAIARHVATPLGVPVEVAAARMRESVERRLGQALAEVCAQLPAGCNPLKVAYGGAGALHACAIAGYAGIRRIVVTPFSAVSSALGSSLLDAGHLYYRRLDAEARAASEPLAAALESMRAEAARDMRGEGFDIGDVRHDLQVFLQNGAAGEEVVITVHADGQSPAALLQAATTAAATRLADPSGSLRVTTVALVASATVPHFRFAPRPAPETSLESARTGSRRVSAETGHAAADVAVYARHRLGPGHTLAGPVLVDAAQTTLFVPAGWRLHIDTYDNAVLEAQ